MHVNYSGVTPIRGFLLFRMHFVFVFMVALCILGKREKVSHVTASWVRGRSSRQAKDKIKRERSRDI